MSKKKDQREKRRNLLIVMKEDNSRFILSRLLEMDGFGVTSVGNGVEALESISKQIPDLVITDVKLAQISGLELIHRLKQSEQTILTPIIAVGTFDNELKDAQEAGASAIFPKPIDFDDFSISVRSLINSSLLDSNQTDDKPDENLILPIKQTIIVVNEHLTGLFRDNPEMLRKIDPFKFERFIAELFQEEGYNVVLTPPRADGGKDLYVYKKDPFTELMFLVECKRYVPPNKVDVSIARQLYGVVQNERASGGIIVTTSYFTKPAKEFAAGVPYQIFLRDFDYLTQWLKRMK